ncbi:MAG: DUF4351 domain-containing protein [Myxococcales bacterium]|nr:DUF4351 domain-containing protein [Myxococcales bacterium]
MRHVAHLFDELLRTRSGAEAIGTILRYLASALRDDDRSLLDDTLAQLSPPSQEHSMRTIADAYRAEGREEGRHQQAACVLLKLLSLKFGPLDESTTARVSAASLEELDRFTERVLLASSVDDVLR